MRLYTPDGKKCNICGERIRQWRTSRGLTQEELAIKMQLHGLQLGQMAISRIETGKRVVTDFELKLFSSASPWTTSPTAIPRPLPPIRPAADLRPLALRLLSSPAGLRLPALFHILLHRV